MHKKKKITQSHGKCKRIVVYSKGKPVVHCSVKKVLKECHNRCHKFPEICVHKCHVKTCGHSKCNCCKLHCTKKKSHCVKLCTWENMRNCWAVSIPPSIRLKCWNWLTTKFIDVCLEKCTLHKSEIFSKGY